MLLAVLYDSLRNHPGANEGMAMTICSDFIIPYNFRYLLGSFYNFFSMKIGILLILIII